jgi:hypothetical protein
MPTLTEIDPIAKMLGNILAGEPVTHGALTLIPILAPLLAEPAWLTLTEAGDRVRVTEVSEAGSVPTPQVTNTADQPLLLLDGEELVGAKQNRILNMTVLVAAGATVAIPVSCVEQGRWAYRSRHFAAGDVALFASLRARKAAWVTRSVRAGRGHMADQGGIWDGVAVRVAAHGVASPTGAMRDFYGKYEQDLGAARQTLAPRLRQIGALVYVSGRWAGLDLLAGPGLFARAWPRLCAGYAADAIGRKAGNRLAPSPQAVLELIAACPAEPAPSIGLGTEYRLAGQQAHGAALVADDRVAHLMVFPDMPAPRRGGE